MLFMYLYKTRFHIQIVKILKKYLDFGLFHKEIEHGIIGRYGCFYSQLKGS